MASTPSPGNADASIRFFDTQFQQQVGASDLHLNPFEKRALPYLQGRLLDYGCGLGNLSIAAARQGCSVVALDSSPTAIKHLRHVAESDSLAVHAAEADLRSYALRENYDAVVSIGLLMFFDCPTAFQQLRQLQAHVRPGGVAVINVLVEGTTYFDMFDSSGYCLFGRHELSQRFSGWDVLCAEYQDFPAANDAIKSFATMIARKPALREAVS